MGRLIGFAFRDLIPAPVLPRCWANAKWPLELIAPDGESAEATRRYRGHTLILETEIRDGGWRGAVDRFHAAARK